MPVNDATQRFSSRVENYVRYRPGYPPEVVELLKNECGLGAGSVVADIASGTGIFTRLLLETASSVFGVEPNPDMRKAGEEFLSQYSRFTSVAGTAEATTLANHSVDLVTAAQAAHWFDREAAHREFVRILKPGGWAAFVWNERQINTAFLREYEQLLVAYGTDYQDVRHEHTTDRIQELFAPSPFEAQAFASRQEFDYAGLEGRLLSSSYTPQSDQPTYTSMLRELRRVFDAHQAGGKVAFEYKTRVFYGHLNQI